ncbi:MAG: tetratricopeptide repeat protein [Thermoleophilia bacterium]|nr:tetratricopeptide repeat protein [Thermoleophilia bacterium]
MKFKSYYWAIIAAAIVALLAVIVPMFVFRENDESSPHTAEELQNIQNNEPVDYTPQIEAFQNLISADAADTMAIAGLGDVYMQSGRYTDALDLYNKAVVINPNDSVYYSRLGDAEFALGMVDVALRDLQRGLEINPQDQEIMLYLGSIFAQTGRQAEATQYWQKARDINPTSRFGHVAQQLLAEQANPDANTNAPDLP